MTNIKSGLVFDFPDATPRFEFSDSTSAFATSSSKKGGGPKLKNSKGFGKFKSQIARGANALDATGSASRFSPDKSTATTASESSFDESVFDDFDLQVFDFGKSKRSDAKPAGRAASPARTATTQSHSLAANSTVSGTHYELSAGKSSFEATAIKPLKLPAHNSPQHIHKRTQSTHSNISTGYISEVSEFSFDRVTVNTNETPMTGASSNVSWNFFEETKDLLKHDDTNGIFVPYTGQGDDKQFTAVRHGSNHNQTKNNTITIKSLLEDTNNTHKNIQNKNNNRQTRGNATNRISMDNISLSDQSNELPISGIVGSNQSIVSEISGDNIQDEEHLNDNVQMHLKEANTSVNSKHVSDNRRNDSKTKSLTTSKNGNKTFSVASSPHCDEKNPSKPSSSILQDFQDYKNKRIQQRELQSQATQPKSLHGNNTRTATTRTNDPDNGGDDTNNKGGSLFQSIMGNVCIGLGFCTWYLCGTDTTQQEGEKEPTKEERQKEMDQTFLGKIIFCSCQDFDCGGMSVAL
ncbi:hypothetical protein ACHAW6_009693 [Cyclotella cf. meneghiniana]